MKRRTWLAVSGVSALLLAAGGTTLALLKPGLEGTKLSRSGREVFIGVSRAVLDGTLPTEEPQRTQALDALAVRIDALVAALPPHAQAELSQLLSLLAAPGGRRILAGLADPWDVATVADTQKALRSMQLSSLSLRRQAYQALHDIVGGAYFSDPSTWGFLGYPGPRAIA